MNGVMYILSTGCQFLPRTEIGSNVSKDRFGSQCLRSFEHLEPAMEADLP
jgi:hypothetical protein